MNWFLSRSRILEFVNEESEVFCINGMLRSLGIIVGLFMSLFKINYNSIE